jgi:copper(I)-binding protein
MNRRPMLAALAVAAALASPASAHDYALGSLEIAHPYAIETAPTAMAGAGYLAITNTGDVPDRLIAVRTDFPRTWIHAVEIDADGVARMHEVDALDIPAGATVTLAPSGLHVMFMGLDAPLVAGASIPATLVFENAGELAFEFKVEPRSAGGDTHDAMPGMAH